MQSSTSLVPNVDRTPPNAKSESAEDEPDFTPQQQRAIIRRIDRRLVLTVGAMYCFALMDRTNMAVADIAGMNDDLDLVGNRYNVINLVFFTTYVVFQPPSTVLIRALGSRIHLSAMTLLWGATMIGMGFVKTFGQLAALRCVLGICEAGFFPSCVYLLSTWYTRYEVGRRYSVFYMIGCVASAFSGILAYGLTQLQGRAGLSGWRWILIIEGTLTCAIGLVGALILVDFPDSDRATYRFLTPRERSFIVARIHRDRGDSALVPFDIRLFLSGARDWHLWAYAMLFFNTATITYALGYTLPLILVSSMGFTIGQAQCLVAPPYALAGIVSYSTAWAGDAFRLRGPLVVFNMALCLVGLPLLGWAPSPAARYLGVFFVTAGATSNIPAVMALQANNIRGQWKRAFSSATLVGFGGVGGISGSLVFRSQDAEGGYRPGIYACIACALLNIVLVGLCDWDFARLNRLADAEGRILEPGDNEASPDFRYTY